MDTGTIFIGIKSRFMVAKDAPILCQAGKARGGFVGLITTIILYS